MGAQAANKRACWTCAVQQQQRLDQRLCGASWACGGAAARPALWARRRGPRRMAAGGFVGRGRTSDRRGKMAQGGEGSVNTMNQQLRRRWGRETRPSNPGANAPCIGCCFEWRCQPCRYPLWSGVGALDPILGGRRPAAPGLEVRPRRARAWHNKAALKPTGPMLGSVYGGKVDKRGSGCCRGSARCVCVRRQGVQRVARRAAPPHRGWDP